MKEKKLVPDPICIEINIDQVPVAVIIGKAKINVENLCYFLKVSELEDIIIFKKIYNNYVLEYVDWLLHSDYGDALECTHVMSNKKEVDIDV